MIKLREHQVTGAKFLIKVKRGILGDEMGTGKTLTALAGGRILLKKRIIDQVLIVVPATLLKTWLKESRSIGLIPMLYHGPDRWRKRRLLKRTPIILTTYRTATSDIEAFADLSERCLLICDEAHELKEESSQSTRALKRIITSHLWLLTGTPVCNRPDDLYSLVHFIDPEFAGSKKEWWNKFVKEKAVMIQSRTGQTMFRWNPVGVKEHAVPALNDILNRIMLRRLKKECLDLPPKEVIYREYNLPQKTKRRVNRTISDLQETGQQLSKILTRVQQVLDGIVKCEDEEGNVISVDHYLPIKAKILRELLDDRSGRVIVWFRFLESLKMLREQWQEDLPIFEYSGGNAGSRDKQIDRWRESESGILFATIRAAGVGLTLTEADTAIFYSAEFSPALNQQAEDRIHRMGQERHTTIYYLYGSNTIEQALVHLLAKKARLNQAVVDGKFSKKDLKMMYQYQLSLFETRKHYDLYMGV